MHDPMNDVEVAVEQRLVGLYSAAVALTKLNKRVEGRAVLIRPKCLEELEIARDALSTILDTIEGKCNA